MQIEILSPSRTKEHQSGFPQILQGLRRLTRLKTFEVDVGMARRRQPRYFRPEETRQFGNPALWIRESELTGASRLKVAGSPGVSGPRAGSLSPARLDRRGNPAYFPHTLSMGR
ncbi:MAG TPA: hypothetical protein VIM99_13360 [Blastocatellia bacterium]